VYVTSLQEKRDQIESRRTTHGYICLPRPSHPKINPTSKRKAIKQERKKKAQPETLPFLGCSGVLTRYCCCSVHLFRPVLSARSPIQSADDPPSSRKLITEKKRIKEETRTTCSCRCSERMDSPRLVFARQKLRCDRVVPVGSVEHEVVGASSHFAGFSSPGDWLSQMSEYSPRLFVACKQESCTMFLAASRWFNGPIRKLCWCGRRWARVQMSIRFRIRWGSMGVGFT
jgi:hypothetical protein